MSKQAERPVTLSAVAKRARVSIATVSYVLNGVRQSRIPESTRMRVRDAARELGYVPNISARSLRMGRSDLVIAHLPGGTPMLQRAAAALDRLGTKLRAEGFTLLLHPDSALSGSSAARLWSAMRPAAVLTESDLLDAPSVALLRSVGSAVVALGPRVRSGTPTIALDEAQLGELAAKHLFARGCQHIALVVPQLSGPFAAGQTRLVGARRAARAKRAARITKLSMTSSPAGALSLARKLQREVRPDGVLAFDDLTAGLLLGALLDCGVRVPEQLALLGIGDSAFCEMLRPRLSSVAIDYDAVASSIGEPLLAAIRGSWREGLLRKHWPGVLRPRDT